MPINGDAVRRLSGLPVCWQQPAWPAILQSANDTGGCAKAENFNTRTIAWCVMVLVLTTALALGNVGTFVLFGLISFQALWEFVTLSPTRRGDHHALFWVFFVMTPLQYLLLSSGLLGMALIMIPVYGFLFLSLRSVLAGDCKSYLERTAKIYWAAMICVYSVSAAPAAGPAHRRLTDNNGSC